jgi:hypothetical protein
MEKAFVFIMYGGLVVKLGERGVRNPLVYSLKDVPAVCPIEKPRMCEAFSIPVFASCSTITLDISLPYTFGVGKAYAEQAANSANR